MSQPAAFDPLYDLDGAWTTALADRYLPLPELAGAKYECDEGRLVVTPTEGSANSFGEVELARIMAGPARGAGYLVYGRLNITFNPGNWIEPDVTVLHRSGEGKTWVPATWCTMPVEFVSPSPRSHRRDKIDKPAKYAEAGIPYFMRVHINVQLSHAEVTLLKLDDGAYVTIAHGLAGQEFAADEPFAMSLDPAELLEP